MITLRYCIIFAVKPQNSLWNFNRPEHTYDLTEIARWRYQEQKLVRLVDGLKADLTEGLSRSEMLDFVRYL